MQISPFLSTLRCMSCLFLTSVCKNYSQSHGAKNPRFNSSFNSLQWPPVRFKHVYLWQASKTGPWLRFLAGWVCNDSQSYTIITKDLEQVTDAAVTDKAVTSLLMKQAIDRSYSFSLNVQRMLIGQRKWLSHFFISFYFQSHLLSIPHLSRFGSSIKHQRKVIWSTMNANGKQGALKSSVWEIHVEIYSKWNDFTSNITNDYGIFFSFVFCI